MGIKRSSANLKVSFIVAIAILYFSAPILAADKPLHVFILHSYNQHYPWTQSQHEGFVSAISNDTTDQVILSTEHLDTKRLRYDAVYKEAFKDYLQSKYANYKPDLIYVSDDNALDFSIESKDQADKIKKIMEQAVDLEVPNKVDYESGPNWGEIK